jgi:hypothetical protein
MAFCCTSSTDHLDQLRLTPSHSVSLRLISLRFLLHSNLLEIEEGPLASWPVDVTS